MYTQAAKPYPNPLKTIWKPILKLRIFTNNILPNWFSNHIKQNRKRGFMIPNSQIYEILKKYIEFIKNNKKASIIGVFIIIVILNFIF